MAHPVATTRDASNRSSGIADKVPTGLLVGGVWQSGIGREGGPEGLLEYLDLKYAAFANPFSSAGAQRGATTA
jgi:hypothetical protein